MALSPPIIIASEDRLRLLPLLAPGVEVAEQLEAEMERARVMPLAEVPDDVVVMDSQIEYEDVATSERRRLQLVIPVEADSSKGRISIFAPLGCALLGLRVGQEIDWKMPGGWRKLRVVSVTRKDEPAASRSAHDGVAPQAAQPAT